MSVELQDSGYRGQLVSMAGVKGREGMGLVVYSSNPAPTTTPVIISGPNPARYYVLITNEGSVNVQIAFNDTFTDGFHTLFPGGSMLINKDMPWTGAIWGKTLAGTGSIGLEAAKVQE